jgi:hypothetical protein
MTTAGQAVGVSLGDLAATDGGRSHRSHVLTPPKNFRLMLRRNAGDPAISSLLLIPSSMLPQPQLPWSRLRQAAARAPVVVLDADSAAGTVVGRDAENRVAIVGALPGGPVPRVRRIASPRRSRYASPALVKKPSYISCPFASSGASRSSQRQLCSFLADQIVLTAFETKWRRLMRFGGFASRSVCFRLHRRCGTNISSHP